ncbi:unnamed protein product [Urochloa humidicola]
MAASTEEHDQKKLVVLTIHDSVTSLGELYGVNSLRSTTSVGNEKKRQRVYNTMFQIPWRCEQEDVGTGMEDSSTDGDEQKMESSE